MTDWAACVARVAPQLVRIQAPDGWGTGFIHYGTDGGARCIATAGHVIEQIHRQGRGFWVWHGGTAMRFGEKGSEDALHIRRHVSPHPDFAVIAVITHQLPNPSVPLVSPAERASITAGMEVGWLGFPQLDGLGREELCFFSGRISFVDSRNHRYLIDGTNVPGCSGGPVFAPTSGGLRIIGALTDYLPHSVAATPEPQHTANGFLPGLSVAADVSDYKVVEDVLSKLPSKRRSLTIKLDQCPRCKAPIVEGPDVAHGIPVLVCQAGCGPLIDLLDNDFVDAIPGGRGQLAHLLHQARAQVEAANAPPADPTLLASGQANVVARGFAAVRLRFLGEGWRPPSGAGSRGDEAVAADVDKAGGAAGARVGTHALKQRLGAEKVLDWIEHKQRLDEKSQIQAASDHGRAIPD